LGVILMHSLFVELFGKGVKTEKLKRLVAF